ncbi:MAG TPA: hypothetical protein VEI01_08330 [Terriglobales bacterium]|nr:hypothetical protein [Terriglobales bacterium]
MLRFWRNPEFVRHVRAELRPARAMTLLVVALFVCALIWLSCWSFEQSELERARNRAQQFNRAPWAARVQLLEQTGSQNTWLLFFQWIFALQAGLLTLWSLFACAQSVAAERDRKTWDFQRTTSLTPSEMLVGKLLGEPVLTYFLLVCLLPLTAIAGLLGGISIGHLSGACLLVLGGAMFLGLCGLLLSTLLETRSRGMGMLGALTVYFLAAGTVGLADSAFPGAAAFSPLSGILRLYRPNESAFLRPPTLFGLSLPWLALSLLLWMTFGFWIVLMLVRNLKRDYDEIRPLSRWQAVGCAAFLNFVMYALFNPARGGGWNSKALVGLMLGVNGAILFVMGLATLSTPERLRVWWQERAAGGATVFSEDGLPWPWLAVSAVTAYALLVWGALAWDHALPAETKSLEMAAGQLLVLLVFITRDVLFLQWCKLTRMSRPILKGLLYLCLYYATTGVLAALFGRESERAGLQVLYLFTPVGAANPQGEGLRYPAAFYIGIALAVGLIAAIIAAIGARVTRTLRAVAAGD